MAAPKGNDYTLKLKTPEIKQKVYKSYCEHIAQGKSKRSWIYGEDGMTFTCIQFDKYLVDRDVFDPKQMEEALAKSFARWEQVVEDSAVGVNQLANTASLQMIMRNKYGWDRRKDLTSPELEDETYKANFESGKYDQSI